MPIPAPSVANVPGQINQTTRAKTTQKNLREMTGEILQWNPDAPATMVKTWLNNSYRAVVDERLWYGMMVRGQVQVPNQYNVGQATFTLGSPTVQGTGTGWTIDMIGRQIRSGFQTGWYNILSVNPTTQVITLDLPWGNPTVTNVGYQMVKTWISLGYNIKYVLDMVNQRQGWRLGVNIPQQAINQWDTWRTTTGWTQILAHKEPTADGSPQYELWPAPTFQQVFPFWAYTQPPDLTEDGSFPAAFIRSDIIVSGALKDALLFRGKNSKYFDPNTSALKAREFLLALEKMKSVDNDLYQKDVQWDYGQWPMSQFGSVFMQSHDMGEY